MSQWLKQQLCDSFGWAWQEDWAPLVAQASTQISLPDASDHALRRGALGQIAHLFTVTESFFFRHPHHFQSILDHARFQLTGRPDRGYQIWSAGCARGEEPYSAAITLTDGLEGDLLSRVRILATDVNREVISLARAAQFNRWSLRGLDEALSSRYFEPPSKGCLRLQERYRHRVTFEHRALQDTLGAFPPGAVDALLFRNVAIYLRAASLAALYRGFAEVLAPDGLLLIAPTDPAPPRELFTRVSGDDRTTTYERADRSVSALTFRPTPATLAVRTPRPHPSRRRGPRPTPTPKLKPKPTAQPDPLPDPLRSSSRRLKQVTRLGDQGHLDRALALVEDCLAEDPRRAEFLAVGGQLALAAGRIATSVKYLRSARACVPDNPLLGYWLTLTLIEAGALAEALEVVTQSLAQTSDWSGPVTIAGVTQSRAEVETALRELCRRVQ